VGCLANVDLVQRREPLAVVGDRRDHGEVFHPGVGACAGSAGDQGSGGFGRVGDKHAGVARGFGVDADDDLAVKVLGDVGDQTVLADGDDDVLRGEEEAGQVITLDHAAAPVGGYRGGDCGNRRFGGLVTSFQVFDAAVPGPQVEVGLPTGAVPFQ
jgi:hypothetical protein